MEKKILNRHKTSVVALDTNTFISMAKLDPNVNFQHGTKMGFNQSCRDIRRMAANGHVKFIITPTVLAEIMRGLTEKEKLFLDEYCFIYLPKDEALFARQTYELARQYTSTSTMRTELENGQPTKDALIMAEATILGLSLLTNNVKDFTNYDRHRHEKSGKRTMDITHINDRMGYSFEVDGKKLVPLPCTSFEFLQNFRDNVFAVKPEIFDAIEKSLSENTKEITFE